MRGEKGIRLKIKVSSVCTQAFSLSSHLHPRSSPHLPFFPQWGHYITYFQPPCPATPHQFLPLIHTPACSAHTRRHTDLSAVKYFSSRSPSPDTEQTLKCVKNLLMVQPPHTFHLSNAPLLSTMVLFNITDGGCPLLPPNTHTEPHTHTHTHILVHILIQTHPLLFPYSFTVTFPWYISIRELRRGMEERSEGGMQGVATKVSRVMFGSGVGGFSSAVLCLCVCVLEWGCAR